LPSPPLDPRQFIQPDARTSLPPDKLLELTDRLVTDETLALRIAGMDGATARRPVTPEELYVWANILSDARALELRTAPALAEYLWMIGSVALGVAGIGIALVDLSSVAAAISAAVGLAGGVYSLLAGVPLFRRDIACMERLNAIDRAASIILAASIAQGAEQRTG
jgi:hypothetical protein